MESKADSYLAEEGKLTLNEASSLGKRDQLMMPTLVKEQAPVPPPCYQRAQARLGPAFHIDALTLIMRLHVLTLCRLAVRLAHRRCSPPLPAGPGGAPRTYAEESLLLIALSRLGFACLLSALTSQRP